MGHPLKDFDEVGQQWPEQKIKMKGNIILQRQDYIKNIFKMTGKQKLIDSMSNLIHHVSLGRVKQQEIFGTLSADDLTKMLCNLDDDNEKVRKMTLVLLAEFLRANEWTQRRFCELTSTAQFQGKLVLSSRFPKSILNDKLALKEVFELLKFNVNKESNSTQEPKNGLFWFIDSRTKPRKIQIAARNEFSVDPMHCIVGIWMKDKSKTDNPKLTTKPVDLIQTQQKMSMKSKIKLSSNAYHQKDSSMLFIPETPTKSTLTQQPIPSKSPNYINFQEQFNTPARTKPNINFLSKTEPIGQTNNVQYPVSSFQTSPLLKPLSTNSNIYVNFHTNSSGPYTSYGNPVILNRTLLQKNPLGLVYEQRRGYGYGQNISGQVYSRRGM